MKDVFLILPILFKNGFRKKEGEKNNLFSSYLFFGAITVFYTSYVGINNIPIADELQNVGRLAEYVATLLLIATFVGAIFSISPMISTLYFSKDGEFFLRLPLKNGSVFIAKMLYVYLTSLFFAVVVAMPQLIIIGWACSLSVAYYLSAVIGLITVPFFGLLISAIVSLPIVAISSAFRNRSGVTTVFMITVYAIIIAAYMYFVLSQSNTTNAQTVKNLIPVLDAVSFVYPYVAIANVGLMSCSTAFGSFDLPISICINIAVALIFFAIILFLAIILGKIFYNRGVSAMLEKNDKVKKGEYKKHGEFASLLGIEFKSIMRNPSLALSTVGVAVVSPIVSVLLALLLDSKFWGNFEWAIIYSAICSLSGINMCACTIFSKDGERLFAYKSMPLSYSKLAGAKLLFCWIVSATSSTLSIILALIVNRAEWFHYLSVLPTLALVLAINAMDMTWDMKKPNLHWISEGDIVRSSPFFFVQFFLSLAVGLLVVIVPVSVYFVLVPTYAYALTYITVFVVSITFALVFVLYLLKNCGKCIQKTE